MLRRTFKQSAYLLCGISCYTLIIACSQQQHSQSSKDKTTVQTLISIEKNIFVATPSFTPDTQQIAQFGFKHIIDLCHSEQHSDVVLELKKQHIQSLGMHYHRLYTNTNQGIDFHNASFLSAILDEAPDDVKLIRCESTNYVGALMAIRSFLKKQQPIEGAIMEGRLWGLSYSEPILRQQLEQHQLLVANAL